MCERNDASFWKMRCALNGMPWCISDPLCVYVSLFPCFLYFYFLLARIFLNFIIDMNCAWSGCCLFVCFVNAHTHRKYVSKSSGSLKCICNACIQCQIDTHEENQADALCVCVSLNDAVNSSDFVLNFINACGDGWERAQQTLDSILFYLAFFKCCIHLGAEKNRVFFILHRNKNKNEAFHSSDINVHMRILWMKKEKEDAKESWRISGNKKYFEHLPLELNKIKEK